jgi:hypothetical protein
MLEQEPVENYVKRVDPWPIDVNKSSIGARSAGAARSIIDMEST